MFDFINLTLQEFIRKFNCEDVCLSYLEERFWNNIPVSPFDPSSKVYNYGNHKYRCRNTGKNFNVKTNRNKKDIVLTPEEVAQFKALGWEGIMNKAKSYNPNAKKTSKKKGCKK